MSVALMTEAFRASAGPTQKLVLLALCDSANDSGECYPSVLTLANKCSLSERAVQKAVAELEACGYMRRERRAGRSTVYWMTPALGKPQQNGVNVVHPRGERGAPPNVVRGERGAPPVVNVVHPRGERGAGGGARGAPITITYPSHEPSIETKKRAERAPERPPDVSEQTWRDWLAHRRAKRAPVTSTVLVSAGREAAKAGMTLDEFLAEWCARGSQGLKAEWLVDRKRPPVSFAEARQAAAKARMRELGGGWADSNVIDMEASHAPSALD